MITAPRFRGQRDVLWESEEDGWPSFRYEEIEWKSGNEVNVFIMPETGEMVSKDGTHLGFREFDSKGSRYRINLASIAGWPRSDQ